MPVIIKAFNLKFENLPFTKLPKNINKACNILKCLYLK